jgi:hypothetical protein
MKPCAQCDTEFTPKRRDQRFCSRSCNNTAHRDSATERCAEAGCERPRRAKGLCNSHYNRAFHPGSQRRSPGDPARRKAQLRIKTQRRRARARDADAEPVDRDVVGERDGWRCGVCRRKVGRALPYPHPRSASLDHIVPLSQDGKHVYSNVRITHLACNTARGNRGGGEQLLLVG